MNTERNAKWISRRRLKKGKPSEAFGRISDLEDL